MLWLRRPGNCRHCDGCFWCYSASFTRICHSQYRPKRYLVSFHNELTKKKEIFIKNAFDLDEILWMNQKWRKFAWKIVENWHFSSSLKNFLFLTWLASLFEDQERKPLYPCLRNCLRPSIVSSFIHCITSCVCFYFKDFPLNFFSVLTPKLVEFEFENTKLRRSNQIDLIFFVKNQIQVEYLLKMGKPINTKPLVDSVFQN